MKHTRCKRLPRARCTAVALQRSYSNTSHPQGDLPAPVQELLGYHHAQSAALSELASIPGLAGQQAPQPASQKPIDQIAARKVPTKPNLAKVKHLRGVINDVSRPYQRGIVMHLCFSLRVPEAARELYCGMKANTLQETIRTRVTIEKEISKCIQAAEHQHQILTSWYRMVTFKKKPLNPIALQHEPKVLLSIKTRLGGARSKLAKAIVTATSFGDTDFVAYAEQHYIVIDALDAWLDACRKVQYPWMNQAHKVNQVYERRVSIMGLSDDIAMKRAEAMKQLGDIDVQKVPQFTHDTRYPPPGTVLPDMEVEKVFKRMKVVEDDPEYQPAPPPRRRARLPTEQPRPRDLAAPERLLLPSAFD